MRAGIFSPVVWGSCVLGSACFMGNVVIGSTRRMSASAMDSSPRNLRGIAGATAQSKSPPLSKDTTDREGIMDAGKKEVEAPIITKQPDEEKGAPAERHSAAETTTPAKRRARSSPGADRNFRLDFGDSLTEKSELSRYGRQRKAAQHKGLRGFIEGEEELIAEETAGLREVDRAPFSSHEDLGDADLRHIFFSLDPYDSDDYDFETDASPSSFDYKTLNF